MDKAGTPGLSNEVYFKHMCTQWQTRRMRPTVLQASRSA